MKRKVVNVKHEIDALRAGKRKATNQRDNWKKRATIMRNALECIVKFAGTTTDEEGFTANAAWCEEQARCALHDADAVGKAAEGAGQ